MATSPFHYLLIFLTLLHLTSAYGDILNRTSCLCSEKNPIHTIEDQKSYVLIEYFNVRLDHTYVVTSLDEVNTNYGEFCKTFPLLHNEMTKRKNHQLCCQGFGARAFYRWDDQTRQVPESWATIAEPRVVVEEECTSICEDNFGLPMFKGPRWYRKSWKETIYDQADMCEGCP